MNLGVHKEESVSAKILDENMSVIDKYFHGEATQDISVVMVINPDPKFVSMRSMADPEP